MARAYQIQHSEHDGTPRHADTASGPLATMLSHGPRHEAQRALTALVDGGRRMVAQRHQASQLFGAPTAPANRTGLPDSLKQGIENLSGVSLDAVKVHYNSGSPARLGAHAYAQGHDIHLAPGQERHLPHEAWHVVQQAQGRVAPTLTMANGTPLNDDSRLEHEADVMGDRALQRMTDPGLDDVVATRPLAASAAPPMAVQRVGEDWIEPIAQQLGIDSAAAAEFVQYLLRTYTVPIIITLLGAVVLRRIYRYFRGTTVATGTDESEPETEPETDSETEEDEDEKAEIGSSSASGQESEQESESEPESEPEQGQTESTSDFRWVGKKAVRAKGKLSDYRKAAWDEFVRAGPPKGPKKHHKPKKKKNMNDAIFKSKQKAQADAVALLPASAPYRPYRAVPVAGSTPFFVNIEKRAEGTKSSSLSGKAGTKPLAVVYGYHGGASYDASAKAEVHVHFNNDDPVDSHTGAHVKIGGAYPHSWASGNASAQVDLAGILDEGFHGDAWKKPATYL